MLKKIFLAVPTISGRCLPATENAIGYMEVEAAAMGWGFEKFFWSQDSLIVHARNVCVAKFLDSDATDMFCLDSDVACGPGAFTRLMSHQADFVCAVYRVKNETEKYAVVGLPYVTHQDVKTGLLEVKDVPFGFARVTRDCIEKMVKACGDDGWFWANHEPRFKCWPLFNTEISNHTFWGEDYYFCRKWRELGGRVFVDPDIRLAHVRADGTAFAGSLADFLRKSTPAAVPLKAAA